MKNKSDLENKLSRLLHIYIFAQEAYLYTEYFHNPETKEELDFVTRSAYASEIGVIMHLMFRTLVIETSKLYSRSFHDQFRIKAFLDSYSKELILLGIPTIKITEWYNQLKENKKTITDVLLLRNKLYAHSDDVQLDHENLDVSFKNLKRLLDLAQEILVNGYSVVFNAHLLTDSPTFDKSRFGILKMLAKAEIDRLASIMMRYRTNGV